MAYQIRSVTQSCLTLCDPMNRSTPGLPVHHQLPEFTQTHVHRVSDANWGAASSSLSSTEVCSAGGARDRHFEGKSPTPFPQCSVLGTDRLILFLPFLYEQNDFAHAFYFSYNTVRLQQYVNHELPDVQAGFRKGRGTRDQIANICWIIKKAREF